MNNNYFKITFFDLIYHRYANRCVYIYVCVCVKTEKIKINFNIKAYKNSNEKMYLFLERINIS